jgi:radical SAM protein with 4Fe4S-binding SPASM domain
MKLQRGAADLLAEAAHKRGRPVTVTFQVTDRCNYECVHCYQEHTEQDELTLAEIERILDQLAEAGVLFLTLMGGEFFMRRDADDILRAAHDRGFAIKLLTTGHHVHERRADLIAGMRPIQVDMSLYAATPHVHEAVTRQQGSWQRTYAAARRLIERKVPVLLKAPVMELNAGDLGNLARLARELGAQSSFDAKITGKEDSDQSPATLRMGQATLAAFYRDAENGMAEFLVKTYSGLDARQGELRPLHHTPCRAGQQAVAINPRGEVWPCNALPIACGNLREQSFADIWAGSRALEEIRYLRWASIAECNVCELRPYCQRCHGMALLEQGKLEGPSLEACRHAVAVRDTLRERGLVPVTETALPPTWARVDADGQHHTFQHSIISTGCDAGCDAGCETGAGHDSRHGEDGERERKVRRSPGLRVLNSRGPAPAVT